MAENDAITFEELKIGFLTMFEKEFNIHGFLSGFLIIL